MTIQDYGSIGEIVGAVATIATLLYLAAQIRQNGKHVAASVADATRDVMNEVPRFLAASDDAARIWTVGIEAFSELTPVEANRFNSLMYLSFSGWHQVFRQGHGLEEHTSYILAYPGVKEWWVEGCQTFPDDFRAQIAQLMLQQSNAAQQSAAADPAPAE